MKNLLNLSGLLFMMFFVACESTDVDTEQATDPTSLSYTEYALEPGMGRWDIDHDYRTPPAVVRIDSDEQMRGYVTGDYPPIDFSTQTLVVAYGNGSGYTNSKVSTFRQNSKGYAITVSVQQSLVAAMLNWETAIVVDKLDENSQFDVVVEITE